MAIAVLKNVKRESGAGDSFFLVSVCFLTQFFLLSFLLSWLDVKDSGARDTNSGLFQQQQQQRWQVLDRSITFLAAAGKSLLVLA